jgi:hypothetical protein
MKRVVYALLAVLILTTLRAVPVWAEDAAAPSEAPKSDEQAVNGSVGVNIVNKHMLRGYELSNGSLVVEPIVTVSYVGFWVTFLGHIDSNEQPTQNFVPAVSGRSNFNETDMILGYSRSFGIFTITPGYAYYANRYANETQEVFLTGALNVISKPTLTVYRDISHYPGTYINLAVSHAFALPVVKGATFDVGASAGYEAGSSKYWRTYQSSTGAWTGPKYSAFHDGMLNAGVTLPVGKHFAFKPMVQYWFPLSNNAGRTIDGHSYNPNGHLDQTIVYGINASFNF